MKIPSQLVFAAALVASLLEVLQRQVLVGSSTTHTVISLVLMFIVGIGVVPLAGEALKKLVPLHVAVVLTSAAGVLQVIQQENLGGGVVLHEVIGIVLIFLAAFGVAPAIAGGGDRLARATSHPDRTRL